MERWRLFAAGTALSIAFLICLFLIADVGRERLRTASENLQATMARRVLIGDLRVHMAEASLGFRDYLLTGDGRYLRAVRAARQAVDQTAEQFIDGYRNEDQRIAASARRLRDLAAIQLGEMNTATALREQSGSAAALELVRTQQARIHTPAHFTALAQAIQQYEIARMLEDQARWRQELTRVRTFSLAGMLANILLVTSAALLAATIARRHREAMRQLAQRRDELEREAAARAAELNAVYGHLQTVQEQERSQLARGLHDELGGLLLAARMDVSWLQQHAADSDPDTRRHRLARVIEVLDQGIDLKRRVVEELRPTLLDNMGFIAAIRWQMDETCGRSGLQCSGDFPEHEPTLNPRAAIALFRVMQEALLNVQRHASAREVHARFEVTPTHVMLTVRDDGKGIADADLRKGHSHGLAGMKHRISALGGTLIITRYPQGGTELRAAIPLEAAMLGQEDATIVEPAGRAATPPDGASDHSATNRRR